MADGALAQHGPAVKLLYSDRCAAHATQPLQQMPDSRGGRAPRGEVGAQQRGGDPAAPHRLELPLARQAVAVKDGREPPRKVALRHVDGSAGAAHEVAQEKLPLEVAGAQRQRGKDRPLFGPGDLLLFLRLRGHPLEQCLPSRIRAVCDPGCARFRGGTERGVLVVRVAHGVRLPHFLR